MKNGPYLFIFSNFFHQTALILKGKHCLLSCHDDFLYQSIDFSQILEKKSGVGGVIGHRFAII